MTLNSSQTGADRAGAKRASGAAYEFDAFRVDPARRLVTCDGTPVPLTSKAFETLLALIERRDRVVSKDELMKVLWPKSVVEEANLSQNIFVVRKALGESAQEPRFVVTVPGVGYRFVGVVQVEVAGDREAAGLGSQGAAASGVPVGLASATARKATLRLPPGARGRWFVIVGAAVAVLVVAVVLFIARREGSSTPSPAAAGRIVLGDIANRTGEPVFDRTLREALAIDLAQSPFLTLLSDEGLRTTLLLMNRKAGEPLTRATALEICRRRGLGAVLDGSIARLGNEYMLTLEAVECREGERVASAQARADSEEHTLDALSRAATDMRTSLGESLASIRKSDRPLREVTTSSLEALQAFTLGVETMRHAPDISAAIPLLEQAIERDNTFASAYAYLAALYGNLAESERAAELQAKAYALRDRVSARERFMITAFYHSLVTGELDREIATYELWIAQYPRDWQPRAFLADAYAATLGNYPRALELALECERLERDQPYCAETVALTHLVKNEPGKARAVLEQALARKLDNPMLHSALFRVATLQQDDALASAQRSWSAKQPIQDDIEWLFPAVTAQRGRFREFRSAMHAHASEASAAGYKEGAADDLSRIALAAAEFGAVEEATAAAAASLELSRNRDLLCRLAVTYALIGDTRRATVLLDELEQRFSHYFAARRVHIPLARALLLAHDGRVAEAVQNVEPLRRFDIGRNWSFLPPYIRGLLLLQAGDGAAAAQEFQRIIDQRGIAPLSTEWVLAHLGAARAAALSNNAEAGRAAYQKFFDLWKDADPDLPILRKARAEFTRLM